MSYRALRTGWTWTDAQGAARKDHEEGRRKHYSRGTILGIWHEFKVILWNRHLDECLLEAQYQEHLRNEEEDRHQAKAAHR